MMKIPVRIPMLWMILGVLVLVSVVPMYFYATRVVAINRERLKANEMLLQNTITRSLGEDIALRESSLQNMLRNLVAAVQAGNTTGNLSGQKIESPQLKALLETFVSSSNDIAYATLLNSESKGISASRITPDEVMARELEKAFSAAREGRSYSGQPISVANGRTSHTIMLVSSPVTLNGSFSGMAAAFIDMQYLIARLRDANQGGLVIYVVDRQGRLVAGATSEYVTGQDMTNMEIVKNYVEQASPRWAATEEFTVDVDGRREQMLGTYKTVPQLEWAVVAQKRQSDAYQDINAVQSRAIQMALIAILMSIGISSFAARKIVTPLQVLAESSRAIARGDFSKRVELKSRTEIGELAQTFNTMSEDLEQLVADLKRAAEENRELFLNSIQMLAGAVDEKDPYTRGHSDRVTRYSVTIAREMGLPTEEVEKVRIAAQLHDVGKIGIEDRILKKPGALTPEEFELMKAHTTKGANILRSVEQLRAMIPGIELHHESLDGRGYPYGLKGDEIPTMPRIIMVADTFDAMTTDRPYQAAMDPEYVVRIINSLASSKFAPEVVAALTACFKRGELLPAQGPKRPTLQEYRVGEQAGV